MTSVAHDLITLLKRNQDQDASQLAGVTVALCNHLAAGNNLPEEIEAQAKALREADGKGDTPAFVSICAQKGIKAEEEGGVATLSSALKAARTCSKLNTFVDPATHRFWFTSFGATAQDVSLQLFFDKFVSHFDEEANKEKIALCKEGIAMSQSVRRPLTEALVGNCERISKNFLQDFLDSSPEYCLPDAIFSVVEDLTRNMPEMCPELDAIVDSLSLEDPAQTKQILRDSGFVFLECSKLSTARCEQLFLKAGIPAKDATDLALGVYMKFRKSLSNEIEIPTKVEQAILDIKKKCIHINLSNCKLSTPDLSENQVGEALTTQFDGVLKLDLSGNNLHAAGVQKIIEIMKHQKKLQELSLRGNNIQASGIEKVLQACVEHPSIITLDISLCHGGPTAATVVGDTIPKTKILNLSCSGNDFGPAGAACVAAILKTDHRMTTLSMGSNNIGDGGTLALSEALAQNEYLHNLHLEDNDISNDGAATLFEAVKEHKSMRKVDISYNWINSEAVDAVATACSKNKQGLQVQVRGFGSSFLTPLVNVNLANAKKINGQLRDLGHKPLAMWTSDDVQFWSHNALGRLDLGQKLKGASIDGARLRSYTMRDLEKDGFTDNGDLKKLIFSFHETIGTQ